MGGKCLSNDREKQKKGMAKICFLIFPYTLIRIKITLFYGIDYFLRRSGGYREYYIFINIFFNSETLKYSFALVKYNHRIYGADNTRNWHIHPFDNPESHEDSSEISLKDFLNTLSLNKDKW